MHHFLAQRNFIWMNINKKKLFIGTGLILFSSLILLWSAFNNGYPLVFSDTGGYVDSSFSLLPPLNDRPLGYGLFLLIGRLFDSLWFPIFFQSLITSLLLFRIAVRILPDGKGKSFIIFCIVIGTVITSDISKFVSLIMPDLFTSWIFLGGLLFLLSNRFADKLLSAAILIISFQVHNSHVFLSYVALICLLCISWVFRSKFNLLWQNSKKLLLLIFFASILLCTTNFITNNGFTLTINNSVYYISKLAYHGILTKTLDKYCSEKDWKLCAYKEIIKVKGSEKFPNWFFWGDDSPLQKMGGWKKNYVNKAEYQDIIFYSIKSFFPVIFMKGLKESYRQLKEFRSSFGLGRYDEEYAVLRIIRRHYPGEFKNFMNGDQQATNEVKVRILPINENFIQAFFAIAAVIILGYCLVHKNYLLAGILSGLIIFILVNDFIVGFTVAAEARYNGKVILLIPYFIFLVLSSLWIKNYSDNSQPQDLISHSKV